MSSIVQELQYEATSHTGSVLGLLRKTILVATKLSIKEALLWAKCEIEGYKIDVPDYRKFTSEIKVRNPYHGWQPMSFQSSSLEDSLEIQKQCSAMNILNPVVEIESWLAAKNGDTVRAPIPMEIMHSWGIDLPGARFVSMAALSIIPDRIRGYVLDWSLELEQKGVLGEGVTFTPQEKSQAANVTTNYFFAPQYQNNGQAGAMGDASTTNGLAQTMSKFFKRS